SSRAAPLHPEPAAFLLGALNNEAGVQQEVCTARVARFQINPEHRGTAELPLEGIEGDIQTHGLDVLETEGPPPGVRKPGGHPRIPPEEGLAIPPGPCGPQTDGAENGHEA